MVVFAWLADEELRNRSASGEGHGGGYLVASLEASSLARPEFFLARFLVSPAGVVWS